MRHRHCIGLLQGLVKDGKVRIHGYQNLVTQRRILNDFAYISVAE